MTWWQWVIWVIAIGFGVAVASEIFTISQTLKRILAKLSSIDARLETISHKLPD